MLESLSFLSWFQRSIIAMVVLIPLMVTIPLVQKHYGLSVESYFFSWFLGCGLGFFLLGWQAPSLDAKDLFTPVIPFAAVFVIGVLLGAPANILLVQAIPQAPNPALPFAIVNAAAVFAYGLSWVLGKISTEHFGEVELNWPRGIGVVLAVVAITLINYKPPES